MKLTREQWTLAEELFAEAHGQPAGQRLAWLERKGRRVADTAVLEEVKALIEASEQDSPNPEVLLVSREAEDEAPAITGTLGPWKLEHLLGRGGMGEVYLAGRADGAYDQQVAVKLLKRGVDTDSVLRRFLRERRILGRLSHPNIARLLDAGATADGRPYLVMELVNGRPITEWSAQRGLGLRPILELMIAVCEAVHAAHRQQVVHRDLKPTNVLVDDEGTVKLLDFGIAKLVGEDDDDATQTVLGLTLATPRYAAPEQLLNQPVTPASDVYSLGMLLYELLTGTLPSWRRNTLMAIAGAHNRTAVIRPSAAVASGEGAPFAEEAARRQRVHELAGDLDQIVLKAVDDQPRRRYANAAQLADDLRRHLDGRPVSAQSDSWWYLARKYLVRNWLPVSAAAAVACALLVGASVALWQAHLARARADELRQVVDFQGAMLKQVNVAQVGTAWLDKVRARIAATLAQSHPLPPAQEAAVLPAFDQMRQWAQPSEVARETLTRYLLDPERAEISRRFGTAPLTEARLRASLGAAYDDLGAFKDAIAELRRAVDLQTAALGADDPDTLATRLQLASTLGDTDDTNAAPVAQSVYEARRRVLGPYQRDTLAAGSLWASLLRLHGANDQARALLEPLLAEQQKRFGRDDPDSLESEWLLAKALVQQGHFEDALGHAQRVLAVRRRALGAEDPLTLRAMDAVEYCLVSMGRNEDARKLGEEVLGIRRRLLGDDHPETLSSLNTLAIATDGLGEMVTTLRLEKQLYEGYRRVLGDDQPMTMTSAINYVVALREFGDNDVALPIARHVVEVRTRLMGPEHPRTLNARMQVAMTLSAMKDYPASLQLFRQVLEAERRVLGPDNPSTISCQYGYGSALNLSGDNKAALAQLQPLYDTILRVYGPNHVMAFYTRVSIALARRDLGDAATGLSLLQSVYDDQRKALGAEHSDLLDTATDIAETLHRLHRDAEAQALGRSVVEGWRKQLGGDSRNLVEAERALAGYDEALGQRDAARDLRTQADAAAARMQAQSRLEQASNP